MFNADRLKAAGYPPRYIARKLECTMNAKTDPKSEDARKTVERFCGFVVYLKSLHRIGHELQSDATVQDLMNETAPMFFTDINDILVRYFILASANITDRPRTFGKYENFTIANLLETIDWPESVTADLDRLYTTTQAFHANIEDARNKLLAHFDKDTFVSGKALGDFPEGDDVKFIAALEELCNIFHKASFGSIFGDIVVATPGDVLDLIHSLKKAVAFTKLFRDSEGEELQKLYKLMQS